MNKFVILLACLASLAAAGVLDQSRQLGLVDVIGNVADVGEIGTERRILRMSQEQLLREKFILDLLQHVQQPLINEELLQLSNTLIVDQDRYSERIDDDMLHIIELGRQQRLLGNNEVFTIADDEHLRQLIGLYRLLVRSSDWDTFQRNACYARQHVNGVLLVNALILAIRDRADTQMLIVPGLHEILPELYYDAELVGRARSIDIGELTSKTETVKPGLLDLVGLGRRIKMNRKIGMEQGIGGGLNRLGMLNRAELWMPWREMRMELAALRSGGEKIRVSVRNENKLVLPVEQQRRTLIGGDSRMSLLTEDIGLKSFLHGLINELALREKVRQIGTSNIDEEQERVVRIGGESGVRGVSMLEQRIRDQDINEERLARIGSGGKPGSILQREGVDNNRLLHVGRRRLNRLNIDDNDDDDDSNEIEDRLNLQRMMQRERIAYGRSVAQEDERRDRKMLKKQRQRVLNNDDLDIEQLPTTGIDNERLLHVNRRRLLTDDVQRRLIEQGDDEDDVDRLNVAGRPLLQRLGQIVNGRRVVVNEDVQEQQRREQNQQRLRGLDRDNMDIERRRQQNDGDDDDEDDDDLPTTNINNARLLHINRRRLQSGNDELQLEEQRRDDLVLGNERERFMNAIRGKVRDGRRIERTRGQRIRNEIIERRRLGQSIDEDDNEGITTSGRTTNLERQQRKQRTQQIDDEDEQQLRLMRQRGRMGIIRNEQQRLDMDLPTTSIDNERLLHINRRRLGQDQEELNDDINEQRLQRRRLAAIGEGRRIIVGDMQRSDRLNVDQQIQQERLNEEREMGIRRTSINNARLLHVNRRHLNNDEDDDDDEIADVGVNIMDRGGKQQRFMHMVESGIRDGRRIIEEEQQDIDEDNLRQRSGGQRRNSIDNERLLQLIRRRLNKEIGIVEDNNEDNIETRQTMQRRRIANDDEDDDDELREHRRIKMSIPRGMEDIGTERNADEDKEDEQPQSEVKQQRGWGGNQQQRILRRLRDEEERRALTDDRRQQQQQQIDEERLLVTGRRRRLPRSLLGSSSRLNEQQRDERAGELLLHQLQQLMARISMERISLGINIEGDANERLSQRLNQPLLNSDAIKDQRYALRLNEMQLDTRRNRVIIEQLNIIEKRLREAIQEALSVRTKLSEDQTQIDRLIGDILAGAGQIQDISILNILRAPLLNADTALDQQQALGNIGVLLQDSSVQLILRRILRVVDQVRQQQLGGYRREQLQLEGVHINDISVDKLRTFIDASDADLSNLLDARLIQNRLVQNQVRLPKMLVARQQRLNHKDFTIRLDLSADRAQRVVIRTLLGPKLDVAGREVSLDEQRLNFMLLDATVADLRVGRNTIRRRSQDISWTARDTTPYAELYQRVMLAIDGRAGAQQDDLLLQRGDIGQQCRFPHRLLLPRGRVDGLPMQLLVIVTPVADELSLDYRRQSIKRNDMSCNAGIEALLQMDRLPLGFPLDRQIDDIQELLMLPNLRLQDVVIRHDD